MKPYAKALGRCILAVLIIVTIVSTASAASTFPLTFPITLEDEWQCPSGCTCFAIGADSRTSYTQFNKTLQFLKQYRDDLDFVIYAGDMDSVQTNKETYHDVQMTNLESYWAMGNHEINPGPGETYIKNLYPSLNNTINLFNDTRNSTYSFEYNNTHIVVLDVYSEEANGSVPYGGSQYNWLKADLEATDKSKQIFVVGHEPAYPENRHVGDSLDQYPSDRDALWSLFDEESVESYFCGHTHYYSKNTSMLNVTQLDAGNMRWVGGTEGDGNSTIIFVVVDETGKNSTISIYSSDVEGNDFNLTDEFTINNSYQSEGTWSKKAAIHINNTGGSALTYYQIPLNITYDSDMNSDFSDIRVKNETSGTWVPYWSESAIESSWNKIWFNVSYIPASTWCNDTYYLYYDNPSASSASNGDATFNFFDDFKGTSLDFDKWNTYNEGGSYSVSNSSVNVTDYQIISKNYQVTDGIIETKEKITAAEGSIFARATGNTGNQILSSYMLSSGYFSDTSPGNLAFFEDSVRQSSCTTPALLNEWLLLRCILNGNSLKGERFRYANMSDNGNTEVTLTKYSSGYIGLRTDGVNDRTCYYDWIRVRKYTSPEPSSTLGNEEQSGGTPPIISNITNGSISSTSQWIDWDVNQTAHNRVLYSNESDLTPAYYSAWDNSTAAPNITLSDLDANTQYWYQAWSYNTVNTTLSDNSSTLTFTTAAAPTDTSFTVTLPSGYTYLKFEPANSTALNVMPNGQTDSQEFFNVTNIGNVNLDIRMRLQPGQNESGIWHMDEGTGTWVNDSSGNDNNGTWYGSATANWTTGYSGTGYALEFDGNDDYVDCGNDESLDITDEITIEAWVKVNGANECGYVIAKLEYVGDEGYGVYWRGSDDELNFYYGSNKVVSNAVFTDNNTWVHGIISIDSSGNISFYRNGILSGTAGPITYASTTANVYLGNRQGGTSAETHFNGIIDEVRIYNRALSAEEVYEHYKGWFNKRPYNVTLKADTDNNPSGATEINTTYSTLYTNLEPDNSVNIWLWSDFDYTPEQDTNRTISINVTQST